MSEKQTSDSFAPSPPENYQRFFVPAIGRPLAEDLLREASLTRGERVLDVGCGTGVVARLAAEKVGPDGRVVGLDNNPGMLAVAQSSSAGQSIEWRHASADRMPFPDETFDVVLCQLSLQFMPDQMLVLREMHRLLVPGGRLVLNVPGPADPLFRTLADAMEHHIAHEAARFVNAVFSLHEDAQIRGMLINAGFRGVEVQAYVKALLLPRAHSFLWQYIRSTPLAGAVAEASEQSRAAMENEVLASWIEQDGEDGLRYTQRIVMASAHR